MKRKNSKEINQDHAKKLVKTEKTDKSGAVSAAENNKPLVKEASDRIVHNKRNGIEGIQDGVLNKLSRLFEKNQQGCAAISFVNNKILITDNAVGSTTKTTTEAYALIASTMNYFPKAANKTATDQDRISAFSKLVLKRLSNDEKFHFKLTDGDLKALIETIFKEYISLKTSNPTLGRQEIITSILFKIIDGSRNKDPNVDLLSFVCQQTVLLAGDFMKIENFLIDKKYENNLLKLAFQAGAIKSPSGTAIEVRSDKNMHEDKHYYGLNSVGYLLMQKRNLKQTGYAIVAIDSNKVHAEAKLVEYLLLTGILSKPNIKIYIAISKLCCFDCRLTIAAVNKVMELSELNSQILTKGEHNLSFSEKKNGAPKDFTQPLILSDLGLKLATGYYCYTKPRKSKAVPSILDTPREVSEAFLNNSKEVYASFDSKTIELIIAEYEELKELHSPHTSASHISMVDRSFSCNDDEAKEDAYNQRSNGGYFYQGSDLNTIARAIVAARQDCVFLGIMDKNNISAKLEEHKNAPAQNILGIYHTTDNKWIAFSIERQRGKRAKACTIDHSFSENTLELRKAVKEVFGVSQLLNLAGYNETINAADHSVLALNSLKSLDSSYEEGEEGEEDTLLMRAEFAKLYSEKTFGESPEVMDSIHAQWTKFVKIKPELASTLAILIDKDTPIELKPANLLNYILINQADFKNIKIPTGGKVKTLFDILIENSGATAQLKPQALALVEELIEMDKLGQQKYSDHAFDNSIATLEANGNEHAIVIQQLPSSLNSIPLPNKYLTEAAIPLEEDMKIEIGDKGLLLLPVSNAGIDAYVSL